jgi:Phage integrase family
MQMSIICEPPSLSSRAVGELAQDLRPGNTLAFPRSSNPDGGVCTGLYAPHPTGGRGGVGLREVHHLLKDVELHRFRIHVRRALDAKGNIRAPKNGEPRIVVLPPAARDALASLERQLDEPAVFLTPRGRRFAKGAIHRYFGVVRAAYGRPKLDFYELRHACATLLLERGLSPEDVAIQLGHTDGGALVRRLYGHPSEDRARARIAAAFEREPVANWSQRHRETA